MIHAEDNEYKTGCDNCGARPKRLIIVRGDAAEEDSVSGDECLALCKRCLKKIGKEMIAWKDEET